MSHRKNGPFPVRMFQINVFTSFNALQKPSERGYVYLWARFREKIRVTNE